MLRHVCLFAALGLLISCTGSTIDAAVVGDTVRASNTFQDGTITGGDEVIFQSPFAQVVDPGTEFSGLATVYDVDFSENTLSMQLVNNDFLSVTSYGAGTFDRYYFGFDEHFVDSISVDSGSTALTNGLTVGLLAPGFQLDVPDTFMTGIPVPIEYENGGFFLEFGEGTDYGDGTLGQSVNLAFTTTSVPEPGSASVLGLLFAAGIFRRKRKV